MNVYKADKKWKLALAKHQHSIFHPFLFPRTFKPSALQMIFFFFFFLMVESFAMTILEFNTGHSITVEKKGEDCLSLWQ